MTRDNTPGAAAESYYIIGGQGATGRLGDVWRATFVGASLRWEEVDTNGTSLPARSDHAAVYDRGGERILVYGGRLDGGLPSSALFELRIR